jgi:signal transduction histidine kinase
VVVIVRAIVAAHGVTISLEPREDEGTRVTVRLPAGEELRSSPGT